MTRASRVGRWVLIGLAVVVAVAVVLRLGVGLYLRSAGGREMVAQRIGDAIGLPVQVEELSVGPVSSSIGLRVLDPALPNSPDAEVLSVQSAEADVSFLDLVSGRTHPHEVHLRGVALSLRLDQNGKLLTTLPKLPENSSGGETPIPHVTVDDAKVTIRQEGRPAFTVGGVHLEAAPNGDKVTLSGTAADPHWGKWKISGEVDRKAESGWVDAATDAAPLAVDQLRSLPAVPESIWANLRPTGRAKVSAHVTLGPGPKHELGYDARIQPTGTATIDLPAAGLALQDVHGEIRIHEGKIAVGGADGQPAATAKLAGGTAQVSTTFDFADEPAVADPVNVSVEKVQLNQLPEKWVKKLQIRSPLKLGPEDLKDGTVSGSAKLKVVVPAKGEMEVFGGGSGKAELPHALGGMGTFAVTIGGPGERLVAAPADPAAVASLPAPTRGASPWRGGFAPSPLEGEGWGGGTSGARARINLPAPQLIPVTGGQSPHTAGFAAALPLKGGGREAGRPLDSGSKHDFERLLLAAVLLQPGGEKRTDQTPVEASLTLKDIDVAQLIEKLDLKVPYKVGGRVTLTAKIGVPLGQATTAASYKITGKLTSPELRFEGLTVQDAAAVVDYQNGVLTLTELVGKVPQPAGEAGGFRGTARLAMSPPGEAKASLTLDRLPVGPVLAGVPDLGIAGKGVVTGRADFRAPYDKLSDPTTWVADAKLTSNELTIADRTAKAVSFSAAVAKGVLTLTDAAATIEGIPVTAAGTLGLTGKMPVDATVKAAGASVTDLRKLVPEAELPVPIEGKLDASARLSGTLSPMTVTAAGRITANDLTLNKTPANQLDVRWELTPDRLLVPQLKANLFGGSVDGKLDYPLTPDRGGSFDLAFKDFDAGAARQFVPDFPVRVTGAINGHVAGTIPPAKEGKRVGNLDVDLTSPKMTVQGFPAERLVGKAAVRAGAIDYSLEGHALGGTFEVKGRYPLGKTEPPPKQKAGRGTVRFNDFDLSKLAGAMKIEHLRPLAGRLDLTFDFENDLSAGSGRVTIRGLHWGDEATEDEVTAGLVLEDGYLQLRDLNGFIAGGILRGRARVKLDEPDRNFAILTLDRADARRLLAPLGEVGKSVTGNLSLVVRGNFGNATRASGTVTLERGTLGGAAVTGLRVPFDVTTGAGGGRLAVREATALTGSGRTSGNVTVSWGMGLGAHVAGQVRLFNVPVAALSPSLGENSFVGTGRITGRFDIQGRNVRSVNDLTGTLVAVLNGASAREIPILQQAVPYLNTAGASRAFQTGDVRATLSNGVFHVQRLALASPTAQLYADGNVTLASKRLDLDVVAHTGQLGPESPGLRLLGLRLPVFGPLPLSLLTDVTNFLSNRTVRLSITGTTANPVVRVNTGALLREEAVRFFLTRYVVPANVADVLGLGSAGGVIGGTSGSRK